MFLKYERVENGQAGLEEMVVNEISAAERRSQIAQLVLEQGKVTVAELVKKFQITETSIRRDLLLLEEDKRLKRVHGGAVSISDNFRSETFSEKGKLHIQAKEKIGKYAVELIQQGNIVLLDSGTTTLQIARQMPANLRQNNHITLVTNSLPIAQEVLNWPSPNLTILGGIFLPDYQATVGPQTIALLRDLSADIAFLGADGLTLTGGATTANVLMAEVDRMMVERARKAVLVTDSSKIGRAGFVTIKPVSAFDLIITDDKAPAEFVQTATNMGIKVILVPD
jgi:DeoR/GlpR family transcriptional regulator of sugar metabolism